MWVKGGGETVLPLRLYHRSRSLGLWSEASEKKGGRVRLSRGKDGR